MVAYGVRRVLMFVPVLFLASVAVWGVAYALPGSPALVLAGEDPRPDQIAAIEERLGLDRPVPVQYLVWLESAIVGDLGTSALSGHSVTSLIAARIVPTLVLAMLGLLVAVVISVPSGIFAALRPHTWRSRFIRGYKILGIAVPDFWLAILLVIAFSLNLGWFPSVSRYVPVWQQPLESLRFLTLPVLSLGLVGGAIIARFVTASMEETLGADFLRTARSKGLLEWKVIARHALPNALIPVVTIIGIRLGSLLSGTVVIEVVFNYPGLGRLLFNAVLARDYAVLQGCMLVVILAFLLVNLLVDLLYGWLDPRVRLR